MFVRKIPNLFPPQSVQGLVGRINQVHGPLDPNVSRKVPVMPAPKAGEENALALGLSAIIRQGFWQSRMPDIYAQVTKRRPMYLEHFCAGRLQAVGDYKEAIGWHVDANFWNFEIPMLVFWVSLTPSGVTAPAVEFAVPVNPDKPKLSAEEFKSRYRAFARECVKAGKPIVASDEQVEDMLGPFQRSHFSMNAGDALVFDQFTFHRTQMLADATAARFSIEFRVVDRDNLPPETDRDVIRVSTNDDGNIQPTTLGALRQAGA